MQALLLLPVAAAWNCAINSSAFDTAQNTCRTQLWDVPTADPSNNITGGYNYLNYSTQIEFYNGVNENRTYSHHPLLLYTDDTVVLIHSSAKQDEDSMGQQIWGGVSHDGGFTWTEDQVILESALLPNQSQEYNFTYWCNQRIPQRAWGPVAVVQSPLTQMIYAVADSSDFYCNNGIVADSYTRGAGRIARPMNISTGAPAGDPCWLYQNKFTDDLDFEDTIYGTEYGMKYCDEIDTLNIVLSYPAHTPPWSALLYNNKYYAADGKHDLQEPTDGIWESNDWRWQRMWRDISGVNNSHHVWTECTCNNSGWFPNDEPLDGNYVNNNTHPIYETDIPDIDSKQYFGYFSKANNQKIRYLVSNSIVNPKGRYPLTLAWQNQNDTDGDWTFKSIGVVRTNPPMQEVPDSRGYKGFGYAYPSAVQVGDNLVVAYSENKQNIWVSVFPISDFVG